MIFSGPPNIDKLKEKRKIKQLIEALTYNKSSKKTNSQTIVLAAVQALRELGEKDAVEPLLSILGRWDKDVPGGVHQTAVITLGELGDERAIPKLISLLSGPSAEVASIALSLFGTVALDALINMIDSSRYKKDHNVNEAMLKTMLRIAYTDEVARIMQDYRLTEIALSSAIGLLDDPIVLSRKNAVLALCDNRGYNTVEPLMKTLEDSNHEVRRISAEQLGKIGNAKCVPHLIFALGDWEKDVQLAAIKSLGNLGSQDALKPIIRFLKEPEHIFGECALNALLSLASNEIEFDNYSIERLITFFKSTNKQNFRYLIIEIFDEAKYPVHYNYTLLHFLNSLLGDDDSEIRQRVAVILGNFSHRSSTKSLIDLLDDNEAAVREAVACTLGKISDFRATKPLIKLLKDQNPDVRKEAVKSLGRIGDKRAMESMLEMLEDNDLEVRVNAIKSLGQLRASSAAKVFLNLLIETQNDKIREISAWALGEIGDEASVKPISEYFIKYEKKCNHYSQILAKIGGQQVEEFLSHVISDKKGLSDKQYNKAKAALKIIRDSRAGSTRKPLTKKKDDYIEKLKYQSEEVRRTASKALVRMGKEIVDDLIKILHPMVAKIVDLHSVPPLLNSIDPLYEISWRQDLDFKQFDISHLSRELERLSEDDSQQKKTELDQKQSLLSDSFLFWSIVDVLWAIGFYGVERLIETIDSHQDEDIKGEIISAILRHLGETSPDHIIQLIHSDFEIVRVHCIEKLGHINDPKVLPVLLELIHDKDPKVRAAAVRSLEFAGDEDACETLLNTLNDKDTGLVLESLQVLYKINGRDLDDPRYESSINSVSKDHHTENEIIAALGNINTPSALIPLLNLLDSNDSTVRIDVLKAISRIDGSFDMTRIYESLKAEDPEEREAAIKILEREKSEDVINALTSQLDKDDETAVRIAILQVLGSMKSDQVVDQLILLLKDEESEVKESAAIALGEIGDSKAVNPLCLGLEDHDIKYECETALGKIGDPAAIDPLVNCLTVGFSPGTGILQDLGWQPSMDITGAKYYVNKKWWCRCVDIGEPALSPIGSFLSLVKVVLLPETLDVDYDMRFEMNLAINAVVKIGGEEAVTVLKRTLEGEFDSLIRTEIAVAAIDGLNIIGGMEAYECLLKYLSENYYRSECDHIVSVLKEVPDTQWKDWGQDIKKDGLVKLYKDTNDEGLEMAHKIFIAIGSPAAESVLPIAKGDYYRTRDSAIELLAEIADPVATDFFIALLSSSGYGRENKKDIAIKALGEIGDKKAIEPLVRIADSYGWSEKSLAEEALSKITGLEKKTDWKEWWEKQPAQVAKKTEADFKILETVTNTHNQLFQALNSPKFKIETRDQQYELIRYIKQLSEEISTEKKKLSSSDGKKHSDKMISNLQNVINQLESSR